MSIRLAGQFIVPASERKIWSYKIKQSSKLCVSFQDRSEMTQQDTPTKKCVRVRKSYPGEALKVIRSSTIKFAKHHNLNSTLDLVDGIRNQVPAVYLAKSESLSCLFLWKSSAVEAWRVTPRCIS